MTERATEAGRWSALAATTPGTVLLQCASSRSGQIRSQLFRDPVRVIVARKPPEVCRALAAVDEAVAEGFYVAGYLSYEAGFVLEPSLTELATALPAGAPLLWFGCYERVETQAEELLDSNSGLARVGREELRWQLDGEAYAEKVEAVRQLIEAGETYQVNFTTEVRWVTQEKPAPLYERLLRAQPVPYAALLHPEPGVHVLSLSPELFLRRRGKQITTKPMKGTASPGLDESEARANAAWLQADVKNRAENVMIVDLLRNDLGRICEMGSVKVTDLFRVERLPTVLQMTSTVEGRLRDGVSYAELFAALFPSGSIVGAPKIHTMRLLHGLEQRTRGVYTGAIGYIAPGGEEAEFSVAIRTLAMRTVKPGWGWGLGSRMTRSLRSSMRSAGPRWHFCPASQSLHFR